MKGTFLGFSFVFGFLFVCFILFYVIKKSNFATFPKSLTAKFMNISVQRKWCAHSRHNCYCVCFNADPDFFKNTFVQLVNETLRLF